MNNKRTKVLALILSCTLAAQLALTGCGSLSRILAEPDPPREDANPTTLTRVLRTGDTYEDIEVLHGTSDEPVYSPDKKAYLYEERGWIYVHVEGEPHQRGYQHGWLLADYVQLQIDHNKSMLAQLYSLDWNYLRQYVETAWTSKVSQEYKEELEGIVEGATERGASFDYLDLLVMNGLEELRDCWFPTVKESYYDELAQGLWEPSDLTVEAQLEPVERAEDASDDAEDTAEDTADSTRDAAEDTNENVTGDADTSTANNDEENQNEASSADDEAKEQTDEDEASSTDDEDDSIDARDPQSHIASQPFVEYDGLTNAYDSGSFTKYEDAVCTFTKQAVVLLATGDATKDGDIILAQNTIDYFANANFSNVMLNIEPAEGQTITMQAAPGLIYSTGQAYSTSSLVVANTRISGFDVYAQQGTPEFLRIRTAVQYSTTLNDFVNYMIEDVNGGIASNWLVGALKTGQIMELELGLSFYNVQKLLDGCFLSFGGVDDTRILTYETHGQGMSDTRFGNAARFVQLVNLVNQYGGKLTTETAQTIVSNHYDAYLGKSQAGSRSICAHYNLDDAAYAADGSQEAYQPYGTVDAKVMSTELAADNSILARWGSACGREFDATNYLEKNMQYLHLQEFLYDRPSEFWGTLVPLEE